MSELLGLDFPRAANSKYGHYCVAEAKSFFKHPISDPFTYKSSPRPGIELIFFVLETEANLNANCEGWTILPRPSISFPIRGGKPSYLSKKWANSEGSGVGRGGGGSLQESTRVIHSRWCGDTCKIILLCIFAWNLRGGGLNMALVYTFLSFQLFLISLHNQTLNCCHPEKCCTVYPKWPVCLLPYYLWRW